MLCNNFSNRWHSWIKQDHKDWPRSSNFLYNVFQSFWAWNCPGFPNTFIYNVQFVIPRYQHSLQLLKPLVPGLRLRAVADDAEGERVGRGGGHVTRVSGGRQQIFVPVARLSVEIGDDFSVLDFECLGQEGDWWLLLESISERKPKPEHKPECKLECKPECKPECKSEHKPEFKLKRKPERKP